MHGPLSTTNREPHGHTAKTCTTITSTITSANTSTSTSTTTTNTLDSLDSRGPRCDERRCPAHRSRTKCTGPRRPGCTSSRKSESPTGPPRGVAPFPPPSRSRPPRLSRVLYPQRPLPRLPLCRRQRQHQHFPSLPLSCGAACPRPRRATCIRVAMRRSRGSEESSCSRSRPAWNVQASARRGEGRGD